MLNPKSTMTARAGALALILVALVLAVWAAPGAGHIPGALAQGGEVRPPAIFLFESDLESVSVRALEAGTSLELRWHIAHIGEGDQVLLDYYRINAWESIATAEDALPPVGSLSVQLSHPANFGPPTFRLTIVNAAGETLEERLLVVPYDTTAASEAPAAIAAFTTTTDDLSSEELAAGTARAEVAWEVVNRMPLTNLVFEQVLPDGSAQIIELPRENLWVASSGAGVVAPVLPEAGNRVTLRLRLLDVISGDAYAEAFVNISIDGADISDEPPPASDPLDATPAPDQPPAADDPAPDSPADGAADTGDAADAPADDTADAAPSATPAPQPTATVAAPLVIGDLAVVMDCRAQPDDTRGWVEGERVPSPDGRFAAQVVNEEGAARLLIDPADGSPDIEIPSPVPSAPIAPGIKWSPDGNQLAFSSLALAQTGGGTIYIVNVDGSNPTEVVQYLGYHDNLTWSSDSTQVFFSSGEIEGSGSATMIVNYRVYAVSVLGGQPVVVADGCTVPR